MDPHKKHLVILATPKDVTQLPTPFFQLVIYLDLGSRLTIDTVIAKKSRQNRTIQSFIFRQGANLHYSSCYTEENNVQNESVVLKSQKTTNNSVQMDLFQLLIL
jgi:hypothetical protein